MTSTASLEDLAVIGRRVLFTYHRDLGTGPEHPGIITGTEVGFGVTVALVRLDGKRSPLSVPTDYEGLTYLDQVVDGPALPTGSFIPVANDKNAIQEHDGVLYAQTGEDGEYLVVVTDDLEAAKKVARHHAKSIGLSLTEDDLEAFDGELSTFVWEPEGAECPWVVGPAEDGDENAVHTFTLYA